MSAHVQELRPGYARVCLNDRRKVRNHLHSVHAIALANLVEYTGNLALVCGMPDDARFIPKNISINYIKKARGTLTGECTAPKVESNEKREYTVDVIIKDGQGDVVVEGKLLTLVGPKK
jgi:acyl-coenzyme A thioesterase PaaI-like protein